MRRRLCDDDDELNEVETETVPQEVREWLSLTFTRSTSNVKRRDASDKVRFKSVAHAIRAGIVVDRWDKWQVLVTEYTKVRRVGDTVYYSDRCDTMVTDMVFHSNCTTSRQVIEPFMSYLLLENKSSFK